MKKLQVTTLLICLFAFTTINLNAQTQGAGYALDFDGITDYIELDNYDYNTSYIYWEGWFCFESIPGIHRGDIIAESSYGTGNRDITAQVSINKSSQLQFFVWAGSSWRTLSAAKTIETDKWNHFYAVYTSSGKFELWLNGNLQSSNNGHSYGAIHKESGTSYKLSVGTGLENNSSSLTGFEGQIDEIRIWNRPLSEAELRNYMCREHPDNTSGMILYYQMNEGENGTCEDGKDVCDKSGNGNHGTKK